MTLEVLPERAARPGFPPRGRIEDPDGHRWPWLTPADELTASPSKNGEPGRANSGKTWCETSAHPGTRRGR